MAGFKMNPNFEREFARQFNAQLQKVFDLVYSRHAGQAVGEVKAALKREAGRIGLTLDDAKLTELATAISAGTRLKVRAA